MKTAAHTFAPEEIMAFVDGELSDGEALGVSAHLDQCADCASLAAEFGDTSRLLREWRVPATSAKFDDLTDELAAAASSRRVVGQPKAFPYAERSNRMFWTIGGGGVLAGVLLVAVFWSTPYRRHAMRVTPYMQPLGAASTADRSYAAQKLAPSRDMNAIDSLKSVEARPAVSKGLVNGNVPAASAPMIARTASLTVVVKNFEASRLSVDGVLARHHAYAAQLEVTSAVNLPRVLRASLRIPAPELDTALGELKSLGRVENETQSGEEVTKQHADLMARIKTSRETEDRLRAILQRTGSVSDVLAVEEEIARVRGEIEGMESEQKGLEHRVDFAVLDLLLSEEYKAQLEAPADAVSTRLHNAFVAGYRNASGTLLGIVLFLEEYGPVLLIWLVILGLPGVLLWLRYRRVRSRV